MPKNDPQVVLAAETSKIINAANKAILRCASNGLELRVRVVFEDVCPQIEFEVWNKLAEAQVYTVDDI